MTYDELSWQTQGNCHQHPDPERFFPHNGEQQLARLAKQVCAGCPVIGECLSYAMNNNEHHGVWGGLSPSERAYLRRKKVTA